MNNTLFSKDSLAQIPPRIERVELDHVIRCSGFERAESSRAEIILQKIKKGSGVKVLSVVGPPTGPPAMSVSEIVSRFPKLAARKHRLNFFILIFFSSLFHGYPR